MILFLDGKWHRTSSSSSLVYSLTPGILKAKGVFETMRVYGGEVFLLQAHLQRMFKGLKMLGLQCPYSFKELKGFLQEAVFRNRRRDARLRLSLWMDQKSFQKIHITLVCQPLGSLFSQGAGAQKGFRAMVSCGCYQPTRFSSIKSLDYQFFRKAWKKAQAKGYDEVIFANNEGFLVEGSRSNVFFVRRNILYTPSLDCGCLAGITRQKILELAKKNRIKVRQGKFSINELLSAQEVFLTNSIMELMPLTQIGHHSIANGYIGKLGRTLHRAYRELIHK